MQLDQLHGLTVGWAVRFLSQETLFLQDIHWFFLEISLIPLRSDAGW